MIPPSTTAGGPGGQPPDDEIFGHALALPAGERDAYLAVACAGDTDRRANLASMLAAHDAAGAGSFMAATVRQPHRIAEAAGDRIGPYVLLENIGEGGCGTVFRAEQREPIRREVALKIIKLGMDTETVVARFEAERQAVAMMDHPAIARVFDAGATAAGRPYFVMELVRGQRITEFCDRERRSIQERLTVFIQVCRAVQHAHQKGIIHRDLKPSNLLVALHDGAPAPKVIDFGIAKATEGRLTDATLVTAVESLIGTPAYMSPEQAEPGPQDIDTRSDVYSLGVVLYELLTGQLPFATPGSLSSLEDFRRAIREREPPLPSARLTALDAAGLAAVAAARRTEPLRIVSSLRGDLDWIVMKCLEKDRARRYDSAASLALDLERHLADEPVTAAAPSTGYVLQKFFRRHRTAVVTGGAIAFLLVGGLTLSTTLYLDERAMLERARYSEQKAREGWAAALKERNLANQNRTRTGDLRALATDPTARAEMLEAIADFHARQGDLAKADALRAEAREARRK